MWMQLPPPRRCSYGGRQRQKVWEPGQQRRWKGRLRGSSRAPIRGCAHWGCHQSEPLSPFKLVSSSVEAPEQSCSPAPITDAVNFLYQKLFNDTVNEIKSTLKPSFRRPYLQVKVQNSVSVRGLYDTGADISCLSLKVFRQIPPQLRPKKVEQSLLPKFKSAGGETLPVHGKYRLKAHIGTKEIQQEFYVIPDLNEPLIPVSYTHLTLPTNREV